MLAAASWRPQSDAGFRRGIQLSELESGHEQCFDYGDGCVAEKHIVVPKPGRSGELDGWLLGTHFDRRRRVTVLSGFEAAAQADGPIVQAALPCALPCGFHGNYSPAA